MVKKFVYQFCEGSADMRDLLGGKGANLAEMTNIGLPVPQGITVTTEACADYYAQGGRVSEEIKAEILENLKILEKKMGKTFGSKENPLLVSVRSGAKISMPGMMDTILNLGLNDDTVLALEKKTNNARFAYDSYRRFIMMFSDVAIGIDRQLFENILDKHKEAKGVKFDTELDSDDLKAVTEEYKALFQQQKGYAFPSDPVEQLMIAVDAIFRSWNNPRAIKYRELNNIDQNLGTAVNVQSMVYGNMGDTSGTGVAFTRNPSNGDNNIYGEFLMNAQGEDVVAGIRTPLPIKSLEEVMPEVYRDFIRYAHLLEEHYRDMQDIEFTIEEGKLFILQTRNGKRTAQAALKVAVDLVHEGKISEKEALLRIEPTALNQLLLPTFDLDELKASKPIATGLPASPGAACGKIYFNAEDAVLAAERGETVVLARKETSPEDIEGMFRAAGILTQRGGMTSHAAVVARGMGRCCVAGCETLHINEEAKIIAYQTGELHEGDYVSIDGSTGNVYLGQIKTKQADMSGDFATFMGWADTNRRLGVRANADNPRDAKVALDFGCEGIGLCRTEHMFFDSDRIPVVRQMICSKTQEQREEALAKILPMQQKDFEEIFRVMGDKSVTIRLLDPPLHEFLPTDEADIYALAREMGLSVEELKMTIVSLHEINPMLGHRGCRLAVTYPEICVMQTTAIIQAALTLAKEGQTIRPEIMVPLAGSSDEFKYVADLIRDVANQIIAVSGIPLTYKVGTMIEIPRAALTADEIAKEAEFFSFGTNDLTQMTFGFSRDDAGKFLPDYLSKKILARDPFASIDQVGVGKLVKMGVELGKRERSSLKCGVCGEHGGDPDSIAFFDAVGLDYVSCSPFRVPVARLAAAQAHIQHENNN